MEEDVLIHDVIVKVGWPVVIGIAMALVLITWLRDYNGNMSAKSKSAWKTWLVRIVIGVLIAGVAVGACLVYQGITISLRAEHALHATLLMVAVVEDYVKANDGDWPRSWEDLEALPPRSGGMYRWPEDSAKLQEHVAIEFAADPAKLARQRPEEFGAIRPIPPCYPYKDYAPVPSLLKTLSNSSNKSGS